MSGEYGLVDPEGAETPGDAWEEIDVSDTAADRLARQRDREFTAFRDRLLDADQFKAEGAVFDDATLAAIYKLVQDGHVVAFGGPISTGKEASVFEALGPDDTDVAVKVYRVQASDFRRMREYLEGDPRFSGIGRDRLEVIIAWTRKEFANLQRAAAAGVRVPHPIAVQRNVLVMELIGEEDDHAPRLKDVEVENPGVAYEVVREYMRRLHAAGLVHGDLSEYNIVVYAGELVIIDVGQAVTVHHPNAGEFLHRDCRNVAAFFDRLGVAADADELFEFVTTGERNEAAIAGGEDEPADGEAAGDGA